MQIPLDWIDRLQILMMRFRTEIDIPKADFEIGAAERMLFVGSCFADNLGRRFLENRFRATVNPWRTLNTTASIQKRQTKCSEVSTNESVDNKGTQTVYIRPTKGTLLEH